MSEEITKQRSSSHERKVISYLSPLNEKNVEEHMSKGLSPSKSKLVNDALRLFFSKENKKS